MTVQAGASSDARRARTAVAALFFTNGALYANIVPRYPEIKAGLDLSGAAFGSAVGAYGLGALLLGLSGGPLVARWGSALVAPVSAVVIAGTLVLVGAAPSWAALAVALFVVGSLDAVADVANNAHALRVERRYGRSILNSLHALWSIGAVSGAAMGSLAVAVGAPVGGHLAVVAVLLSVVPLAVRRRLLPGREDEDRPPVPPSHAGGRRPSVLRRPRRGHLLAGLAALGAVAASAQSVEDAGAAWSALYLRQDLGAAAAVGGFGFIALQTCQTVGRLLGDPLVTRFGDRAVARAGAALGGTAMAAALSTSSPLATVAAFGLVGLGISTLIPASMRQADALPGLPPGAGLTVVGTIDRIVIFVAPPVIGAVADVAGLRVGLLAMPLAMVVAVLAAGALPGRSVRPASG